MLKFCVILTTTATAVLKITKLQNSLSELYIQLDSEKAEKVKALAQLKLIQSQLVSSEKMASLGTLLASVAHEINNPANFVYGISHNLNNEISELKKFIFELAGEEADDNFIRMFEKRFNKISSSLGDINDGSERIKTIVRDLRSFSRVDGTEKKTVDITEGINSTIRLIQAKYSKEVEFICDFQAKTPIECLPAQLNQVFMNIIVNACQAIQEKQKLENSNVPGKLIIKTYQPDNSPFEAGDVLAISFSDDGAGMSEAVKAKIFEPFFTTKDVGSGTGMGMSITYSIIEKHNGKIDIISAPGYGTTFTIFLPVKSTTP